MIAHVFVYTVVVVFSRIVAQSFWLTDVSYALV